jgi:glycosyltransferase involved in cell wall biosynthesis
MRILVLCPHYAPDVAPTGEVMTSIVEGLAARGHRLHVVTSLPWYEHHRVEVDWRGSMVHHADVPWGRITRVHPFPTDKTNLAARAVGFAGFTGLSGLEGAITRSRPDVVLAMSPPLTLGPAAVAIGRLRRIPVVFNIQDVFPDVAVELGMLTNAKVIAAASWLERTTYAHADAVTVLSDDLRDNVVAKLAGRSHRKGGDPDKVRVIPNFVDFQPRERLAEVLAAGDIHLVPLRRGLARSSVPSKTYSILAAGRPFVASIDPGTEIERIAERSGAGIAVAPDDPEAFTAAVRRLVDDPTEAQRMGAAGRRWVEGWASPAAVAESYETLFAELVARR